MFGVGGVGVVNGAVLCVNVEFVPQGSATGGHGHRGFGGHAAVRGHALCAVTGGPGGSGGWCQPTTGAQKTCTAEQRHFKHARRRHQMQAGIMFSKQNTHDSNSTMGQLQNQKYSSSLLLTKLLFFRVRQEK